MRKKSFVCLMLVLFLIMPCLTGCRGDKQETAEVINEQQEEATGMESSDDSLVIEVPEGMDVEEGGEDFGR